MKTKMFFLVLALWILSAASVNAQVTIGSIDDPDPSAVLDLKTTNQGLLLPRIALVSTASYAPLQSHVAGMVIYNTAISGSGATIVTPGIYSNDGSKWIRMAEGAFVPVEGAPQITTQPALFTFSRIQDVEGDPHSDVTSFSTTLKIVASGDATLKYQWYQKPKNSNGSGTLIPGATLDSYTVNIPEAGVDNWGLYSYYCVVSNTKGSVVSNVAEVALGCGAKTVNGGWLSFMCHNLGADRTLDPFKWNSINDTTSYDIKGWLFQWGRQADGHQWRSAPIIAGPYTGEVDANGQIPSTGDGADYYGKFISGTHNRVFWREPFDYTLWSENKTINDPCPDGWRIPTVKEFASLLSGDATGKESTAQKKHLANTLVWTVGHGLCPDGTTRTLNLPAAGWHFPPNLTVQNVSSSIIYFACNNTNGGLGVWQGTSAVVGTGLSGESSLARSIRCVRQ